MSHIRSVKITTLADNVVGMGGFLGQWGLSFLIEVEVGRNTVHQIIFDTGAVKEALFHNVKQLKLDLSRVESIVLSHGHADHTSSTVEIMKRASGNVRVIVHPNIFLPKFIISKNGQRKEGGLPKGERIEDIKKYGAKK